MQIEADKLKKLETITKQAYERIEAKHTIRLELEILKSQSSNKLFINNIRGP
ncbi:MAG: hypothetical protein QXL78_04895 [Methanocellales archaeon]